MRTAGCQLTLTRARNNNNPIIISLAYKENILARRWHVFHTEPGNGLQPCFTGGDVMLSAKFVGTDSTRRLLFENLLLRYGNNTRNNATLHK